MYFDKRQTLSILGRQAHLEEMLFAPMWSLADVYEGYGDPNLYYERSQAELRALHLALQAFSWLSEDPSRQL